MWMKKLVVAVTVAGLLGSNFALDVSPGRAQMPHSGNGQPIAPTLGGSDGAYGRMLPGPSTTAPYVSPAPYLPNVPHAQPQVIQRPVGPTTPNVCQPGGAGRPYQTVLVPRSRTVEPFPMQPPPATTTVTHVTVSQGQPGAAAQVGQPSGAETRAAAGPVPEVDELSRIEAGFNIDPLRVQQVAALQVPAVPQPLTAPQPFAQPQPLSQLPTPQLSAQPPQLLPLQLPQSPPQIQPTTLPQPQMIQAYPVAQVQPRADQGFLGPFGAPLRQYGYAMFAANVSTFAPVDDIPVGPDYVLGPGDDLSINVWGAVDSTLVRTVDRNGRIVLPKVGDLRLWGLTFSQADRLIRDELSRYFRGFQTSVTMGRLRTVTVHVVGEVCQPGVYTLSSLSTITNALYSAGGPTKLGSLREVRLLRSNVQVARIDLYDFLQRGDRTRDYRLESGDTIFVPTIGDVVAVAGEVKRPAIYEVVTGTRLADVVGLAGGITPTSYLKRVQVVRAVPDAERVTLDVDLASHYLKGDEASNPLINAGDLVLIHRADPRIYNVVKVEGAVRYPGTYELKPMMRIGQLLPADKLLPEAHAERVEVARRRPDLSMEILAVDLKKVWGGDQGHDLLLKPLDEVTVRTELKSARMVQLSGQVVRPGIYTIAEGEKLSSVLERAGGFVDRAFLKGAVFTRAALRKTEQEQLEAFMKVQEQRMLASASTMIVGAEKEEVAAQQQALQARREALRLLASKVVVGRMVVHVDHAPTLRGTENDVVLIDGDSLTVPEAPQSVLVLGAVRNSTSVQYKEGAGVDYYINRVGGFSKEADKKEAHIVKADGSGISSFTNIRTVEAGDTIMVPPKEEEKVRTLPTIRDVMQTLGSALLGFAALAVLF
jgi:protein involved in polysaccharide export with SLBB domain